MRVGDCESYAKIINWINCELELCIVRTHSRRQSSRDIRVYMSLKSKLILSPQNFAVCARALNSASI